MGTDQSKSSSSTNFNLTGTSEFMDRTDKIISDATELHAMQNFITKKIFQMESSENIKQSEVRLSSNISHSLLCRALYGYKVPPSLLLHYENGNGINVLIKKLDNKSLN